MSENWKGGSTRAWRKQRARILARDDGVCQIRKRGCTGYADAVHHKLGKGVSERDEDLEAACQNCNNKVGDPTQNKDPQPQPRTRW